MFAVRLLTPADIRAVWMRYRGDNCGGRIRYRTDPPDRRLPQPRSFCKASYTDALSNGAWMFSDLSFT